MFSSQNLVKNTKFLTSNFDVHLMLQDILALSLGNSTKELFAERKNQAGVSLFSEVTNRTCQEAGVPLLYCCCNNGREKMEPDDPIILSIANGVLVDINLYLRWDALTLQFRSIITIPRFQWSRILSNFNSGLCEAGKV